MFFIFVLVFVLVFVPCNAKNTTDSVYIFTSFREPSTAGLQYLYSYDALHWDTLGGIWMKPEIGNEKPYIDNFTGERKTPTFSPTHILRDPSILQGPDGTFHLVWTIAWSGSLGFGYSHSNDLIHWSPQIEIPVMANIATNNVWAPELFYDEVKEEYLIIWSSAISPLLYTEADKLGTNTAHRPFYTKTKDFLTFTPAKPYFDIGYNSIDGFLVKKDSADYRLILKDNRKPGYSNILCVEGPTPEGPFSNPVMLGTPEYSEGACAVKVGDEWIIYFDVYKQYRYGAVSTKDFQTFTPIDDKISVPAGHKHGTIIKISKKQFKKLKKARNNLRS